MYPNLDIERKELKLWEYIADELADFIDDCHTKGLTFVATEWELPNLEFLVNHPNVQLITCWREPISLFVSNFYFDLYLGFTKEDSILSYLGSSGAYSMDNYSCRLLSCNIDLSVKVVSGNLDEAIEKLSLFDYISILEKDHSIESLAEFLSWSIKKMLPKELMYGKF